MEPASVTDDLQKLIAEEMYLLGQELEDSFGGHEADRLDQLAKSLDDMDAMLIKRRGVRPSRG